LNSEAIDFAAASECVAETRTPAWYFGAASDDVQDSRAAAFVTQRA
jgi:hypothetical protein